VVHGRLGDEQPLGDLPVGQAPREQGQHLLLAAVSPPGAVRVAGRGPRGIARIPSSFIRRRAAAAVAPAPILSKVSRARRSPASSEEPSQASAASYGRLERRVLGRQAFVQGCHGGPVAVIGAAQGPFVLRRRFPVRPERGTTPGRYRRVPQHRPRVPGTFGMMSEYRRVGTAMLVQGGERPGVQFSLALRCDPGLDCHPGQLMPEPESVSVGDENPGRQAIIG
jgi:hypothetical protein